MLCRQNEFGLYDGRIVSQLMDEPTNVLDREALGALSAALKSWAGAVLP
jgi:hypothetical protein